MERKHRRGHWTVRWVYPVWCLASPLERVASRGRGGAKYVPLTGPYRTLQEEEVEKEEKEEVWRRKRRWRRGEEEDEKRRRGGGG